MGRGTTTGLVRDYYKKRGQGGQRSSTVKRRRLSAESAERRKRLKAAQKGL